jgi:hypothetical protein
MRAPLEWGTPAPRGAAARKGVATMIAPSTPPFFKSNSPLAALDTPTMLRNNSNSSRALSPTSAPSSPTGSGGVMQMLTKGRALMVAILGMGMLAVGMVLLVGFGLASPAVVAMPAQQGASATAVTPDAAIVSQLESQVKILRADREILEGKLQSTRLSLDKLAAKQSAETSALVKELTDLRAAAENPRASAEASSSPSAAAESPPLVASTEPARAAGGVDDDDGMVHVWFVYDAAERERLGDAVELFWLSGNSSERHYATLPAGQRVEERTYPGQCWRARSVKSSQHVAMYCATSEKTQTVNIEPHAHVALYFHYPEPPPDKTAAASGGKDEDDNVHASAAAIYELRTVLGQTVETLVGRVVPGSHLSTSANAGAKYTVRDERSRRPLVPLYEAGFEAEQHIDIAATRVTLVFELSGATEEDGGSEEELGAAAVFWTWGGAEAFAREHLHGTLLKAGERLVVPNVAPGEEWVVRSSSKPGERVPLTSELLMDVRAEVAPAVQRHVIVLSSRSRPPQAHPQPPLAGSGGAAASKRLFPRKTAGGKA